MLKNALRAASEFPTNEIRCSPRGPEVPATQFLTVRSLALVQRINVLVA